MALATPLAQRLGLTRPLFGFAHSVGAAMDEPEEISDEAAQPRDLREAKPFGIRPPLPSTVGDEADRARVAAAPPAGRNASVTCLAAKHGVPPRKEKSLHGRRMRSQTLFAPRVEAALASEADLFAAAPEAPSMPHRQARIGGFLPAMRQHRVEPPMREGAGQSIAVFDERAAVAEIMDRLEREAEAALAILPRVGEPA